MPKEGRQASRESHSSTEGTVNLHPRIEPSGTSLLLFIAAFPSLGFDCPAAGEPYEEPAGFFQVTEVHIPLCLFFLLHVFVHFGATWWRSG